MTVNRTTSEAAADRSIQSVDTVYATARAGNGTDSGTAINSTYDFNGVGQTLGGPGLSAGQYAALEAGMRFSHPILATHTELVSAWFSIHGANYAGSKTRTIELRLSGGFGVGNVFTTDDFVPGNSIPDLTNLGTIAGINNQMGDFYPLCAGSFNLLDRLRATNATINLIAVTDLMRIGDPPTADERNGLYWGDHPNSWIRPALVKQMLTTSALDKVQGASAQLSDGTSVYLDGTTLKYSTDNVTEQTIQSLPIGSSGNDFDNDITTRQLISLCVDPDDNIWVVGKGGASNGTMVGKAYLKGAGYTWTPKIARTWDAPAYPGAAINNVAVTWNQTSNLGHLMVLLSHSQGTGHEGQVSYMTISCNNLQAGAGSYVAASGSNPALLSINAATRNPGTRPINDTGTGLDVHGEGTKGVMMCFDGTAYVAGHGTFWPANRVQIGRYTLGSTGTITSSAKWIEDDITLSLHPDTKAKIIAIDANRVGLAYGDRIHVYNWAGGRLGEDSMASAGLYDTPVDWIYDPAENRIWAYYESSGRQIVRRGLSLNSYTFSAPFPVGDPIGVAGDLITAIRLPRGTVNERTVRIEIAVRSTPSNVHSVIVLDDPFLNWAPDPPTLAPRANFDAADSATFNWTFSDINTDDAQTAYELEIRNQDGDVLVHDTGKVPSSAKSYVLPPSVLTNDSAYSWKVRTWDLADAVGPFSAQGVFQTLSTALTTIDSPPTDNPDDATSSTYLVTWSTTQITQARYRMLVTTTANGETFLDTGYVISTQTARQLNGLANGTEYEITVWVRNNVDVESDPGIRLLTPVYAEPPQPVLELSRGDAYIFVSVTNPPPGESEADPTSNDLYRSPSGEDAYVRIASIPHNGSYRDYHVRSDRSYDYYCEAVR